ncbi:unnamed protein product [Brachionus calyciflorus]|uniref:HTH CENPB-type domain-containing protein n=1 Tax=Brachionus calyciflorus TaxID=104777 RepID=A0A814L3L4_9BILA|nr:unnamed protein product [Brachionus calyciflorus]
MVRQSFDIDTKKKILDEIEKGVPINTRLLREKAIQVSKDAGLVDFKASNGYLGRFSVRKSIAFGTVHGESGSVDNAVIRIRFGKANKERVTVFVASSMMGEKLPLAIIGKSEKPRNFNSIERLNFSYFFNSNAWMTSEVFLKILNDMNKKMAFQKRFILLFVDNCWSHPDNLKFSNVKVLFLPPNTTSVTQPMDAGVKKCLKGFYRVKFCRQILSLVEKSNKFVPTDIKFFQSLEMLNSSWDEELKPSVISNCFRHCGFFRAKCRQEPQDFDDIVELPFDDSAESELELLDKEYNQNFAESKFDDFVDVDTFLITSAALDEGINEDVSCNEDLDDPEDLETDQVLEEEIKISKSEAIRMINGLKLFSTQIGTKEESLELLEIIRKFERKLFVLKTNYVQTKLTMN